MDRLKKPLRVIVFAVILFAAGFYLGSIARTGEGDNVYFKPEGSFFLNNQDDLLVNHEGKTLVGENRVVEGRTLFSLCGHWEPLTLGNFSGLTPENLRKDFPSSQGWHVEDNGEKIIITKEINALCPEDDKKRHLGSFGEYVAVVKGPPGIDGGIVEVTEIKLSELPQQFRVQAENGTLDFSNAQHLLEALDSLDEYEE